MKRKAQIGILLVVLGGPFSARLSAQDKADVTQHPKINSFSVGPDEALNYPGTLLSFPDEHTTFMPLGAPSGFSQVPDADDHTYLVFGSSSIQGGIGGTIVLQTKDLKNFDFASAEGYTDQVMTPPLDITTCGNHFYDNEFDENYAAPGSVVPDPTLPPGQLIMIYEAENHCPGGVWQVPFYATVALAQSSDNGRTWPGPVNSEFGGPDRHPVLKGADPEPPSEPTPPGPADMGDAIPSALVDRNGWNETYLYVVYTYSEGPGGHDDGQIRIARAKFGDDDQDGDWWGSDGAHRRLTFLKWFNGAFSERGIGGLDSGVVPASPDCVGRHMPDLSYNEDLGLYLLIFICNRDPDDGTAAWYYSTATSLDLQDWTEPQMIVNSRSSTTIPCDTPSPGTQFNGLHPSFMSPGAAGGHTKLTGRAFFLKGCVSGFPRAFTSRTFTITTEP